MSSWADAMWMRLARLPRGLRERDGADAVGARRRDEPGAPRRLLERAGGDPERIDGPTITALALEGDPMALRGLAEVGEWLGRGFALVAAVVDPSVIVIGGGLAEVRRRADRRPARTAYAAGVSIRWTRPVAPIRLARLGTPPASSPRRRGGGRSQQVR